PPRLREIRLLRDIFLIAHPPLLFKEGNMPQRNSFTRSQPRRGEIMQRREWPREFNETTVWLRILSENRELCRIIAASIRTARSSEQMCDVGTSSEHCQTKLSKHPT